MLTVSPDKRLSARACLEHRWFSQLTRADLSMVRWLVGVHGLCVYIYMYVIIYMYVWDCGPACFEHRWFSQYGALVGVHRVW